VDTRQGRSLSEDRGKGGIQVSWKVKEEIDSKSLSLSGDFSFGCRSLHSSSLLFAFLVEKKTASYSCSSCTLYYGKFLESVKKKNLKRKKEVKIKKKRRKRKKNK